MNLKQLPLVAFVALLALTATAAYADDEIGSENDGARVGASTTKVTPLPFIKRTASTTLENQQKKKDERKDEIKTMRASTTEAFRMGSTTNNGLHLGDFMAKRFRIDAATRVRAEIARFAILLEAHIHRLEDLIARIETRAGELDAKGISTADGRTHLATATTEVAAAKVDLAAIKADAALMAIDPAASTTPAAVKEKIKHARELMQSAREHLRTAYDEIKAALRSFRDAVKASGQGSAGDD